MNDSMSVYNYLNTCAEIKDLDKRSKDFKSGYKKACEDIFNKLYINNELELDFTIRQVFFKKRDV